MSRSKNRLGPVLSALGASALLLVAQLGSDSAHAQRAGGGRSAAGQSHRPASVGSRIPQQARDRMPDQASSRLPQHSPGSMPEQAQERVPQQVLDRAPPFGGSRPDGAQNTPAHDTGLSRASEKAADQAKAAAPPLGGTLPEQSQSGDKPKSSEKSTEKAKPEKQTSK
jgi:hypothetical protein